MSDDREDPTAGRGAVGGGGNGRETARSRRRGAVLAGVAGVGFAVAGLAFVVERIVGSWSETGPLLRAADPGWLGLALVCAASGMVAIALPWPGVVRVFGDRLGLGVAVAAYFLGEIGKYVPGGIWPVIGRGELAARQGVRRNAAYGSVVLSLVTLYLAALLLAAVLLPVVLLAGGESSSPVVLVVLVPVGLVALHPRILGWLFALGGRLTRRELRVDLPAWSTMVVLVMRYVPAWLLIGTATHAVTRALGADAAWTEVCLATVLSWSAGFLVAPAPGGVGVREAAFVAVASSLGGGTAAAAALCARLMFMGVDAVGAALGAAFLGTRHRAGAGLPARDASHR